MLGDRATREDPHGDDGVAALHLIPTHRVGPGAQRRDVGGDPRRRLERPGRPTLAARDRLGSRLVGDDDPVVGDRGREREGGLEVGLLEHGIHPAAVGDLELAVEVDLVVDGVDEAVQSLAAVGVAPHRVDDQDVVGGERRQRDPAVRKDLGRVEGDAVEGHRRHRVTDEVDPRGDPRCARSEPHRRRREERRGSGGEVEHHVVTVDVEQRSAGCGFVAGEVRAGHRDAPWVGGQAAGYAARPGQRSAPRWFAQPSSHGPGRSLQGRMAGE